MSTSSNRSNCSRSLKYSNVSDSRLANQQLSKSTEGRPKPVAHHPVTAIASERLLPLLGEDEVHTDTGEQALLSGMSDLSEVRPTDPSRLRGRAHGRFHDPR